MRDVRVRSLLFAAVLAAGLGWAVNVAWSNTALPIARPLVVSEAFRYNTDALGRNETLSHLFGRHNMGPLELRKVLAAAEGMINPRRVRPDEPFEFRYRIGDSIPDRVTFRLNPDAKLRLMRDSLGIWKGVRDTVRWEISTVRVEGEIDQALARAIHRYVPDSVLSFGERVKLVDNLANDIFGWEIDFFRDIRPGDRFTILFDRLESSEGEVRYGRTTAAVVEAAGRENRAYVLTDQRGRNIYYDERGRSLRRAFLLYPVRFSRISSSFSTNRLHPVLRVRRPHLGTDYAADIGTPIHATADGTVRFAGRDRGYGIMVAVRHPQGIETRYAHMSRVASGIRPGVRVVQGQTIGFVGMTGLANGPHVHYEFIRNGSHMNHRRVDMGDGTPVPEARRDEFFAVVQDLDRLLEPEDAVLATR